MTSKFTVGGHRWLL